tara:strand:+ start:241 stop:393 length:153 start_codon:yes stop_codon:yes gene_type:complete
MQRQHIYLSSHTYWSRIGVDAAGTTLPLIHQCKELCGEEDIERVLIKKWN